MNGTDWSVGPLAAVILVGSLLGVGCKSTNNNKPSTTTSGSATKASSAPTSGGDARSTLQDLVGKLTTREVKAAYNYTYTYSSGSKGEPGNTTAQGTFAFYSKPPNWRWDVTIGGRAASIISSGGNSYLCTTANGGCTKQPANASNPDLEGKLIDFLGLRLPFLGLFADPQSLAKSITTYDFPGIDRSSKTVAGQDGDCFSLSMATYNLQAFELCFSNDGVLLSFAYSAGDESGNFEATSVEGSVATADVQPPPPVTSLPGGTQP